MSNFLNSAPEILQYGISGLAAIFAGLVVYQLMRPHEKWLATPQRTIEFRRLAFGVLGFLTALFMGSIWANSLNPKVSIVLRAIPEQIDSELPLVASHGEQEFDLKKGRVKFNVERNSQVIIQLDQIKEKYQSLNRNLKEYELRQASIEQIAVSQRMSRNINPANRELGWEDGL